MRRREPIGLRGSGTDEIIIEGFITLLYSWVNRVAVMTRRIFTNPALFSKDE